MALQSIAGDYWLLGPSNSDCTALFWVKAISHFFSQAAKLLRSSCRMSLSFLFLIHLYRIQSSAKSLILDWTHSGMSFTNIKNRSGPITVPCGTPLRTLMLSALAPSTVTCCTLSVRKALIHSSVIPLTP